MMERSDKGFSNGFFNRSIENELRESKEDILLDFELINRPEWKIEETTEPEDVILNREEIKGEIELNDTFLDDISVIPKSFREETVLKEKSIDELPIFNSEPPAISSSSQITPQSIRNKSELSAWKKNVSLAERSVKEKFKIGMYSKETNNNNNEDIIAENGLPSAVASLPSQIIPKNKNIFELSASKRNVSQVEISLKKKIKRKYERKKKFIEHGISENVIPSAIASTSFQISSGRNWKNVNRAKGSVKKNIKKFVKLGKRTSNNKRSMTENDHPSVMASSPFQISPQNNRNKSKLSASEKNANSVKKKIKKTGRPAQKNKNNYEHRMAENYPPSAMSPSPFQTNPQSNRDKSELSNPEKNASQVESTVKKICQTGNHSGETNNNNHVYSCLGLFFSEILSNLPFENAISARSKIMSILNNEELKANKGGSPEDSVHL